MLTAKELIEQEINESVSRSDVMRLKKLVEQAENLAESFRDSEEDESKSYWYWQDVFVALATVHESLMTFKPIKGSIRV